MSKTETSNPPFIEISETTADKLYDLEPGSEEARQRIMQITHELGEDAVNAVGILVVESEAGELRPTAFVSLDVDDPGTHIRRKSDAIEQGSPYGKESDLPPVEEAYRALTESKKVPDDTLQDTTEDLDSEVEERRAVEAKQQTERNATLDSYETALNKLIEELDSRLIEPEAQTRYLLDGQVQDLRQAINNARLNGGNTDFSSYFHDIRTTLTQRGTMFEEAQESLNMFAETSNTLVAAVDTDREGGATVAKGMNRISEEHRNGINIQGALTIGLDEQQRQVSALQAIEWALDDNDDMDSVRVKFSELEELIL